MQNKSEDSSSLSNKCLSWNRSILSDIAKFGFFNFFFFPFRQKCRILTFSTSIILLQDSWKVFILENCVLLRLVLFKNKRIHVNLTRKSEIALDKPTPGPDFPFAVAFFSLIISFAFELMVYLILVRGSRPGKNVQLTESEIRGLCLKSREIFLSQPILLELEAPLKICGELIKNMFTYQVFNFL